MAVHGHLGADIGPVAAVAEVEVGALQRRVDVERCRVAVLGELDRERDRLGLVADREIAFRLDRIAVLRERLGDEMRFRRLRRVEEIGRRERVVALAAAGVDAREVDRDVELRFRRIGCVVRDRRVELLEAAVETFLLIRALSRQRALRGIDLPVARERGEREQHCERNQDTRHLLSLLESFLSLLPRAGEGAGGG